MGYALRKTFPAIVTGSGKLRAPLPSGTPKIGLAREEACKEAADHFRQNAKVFLVDNHWRVVAENVYCAKKMMGLYHDLPYDWWNNLKVEFIGIQGRVPMTGKEIVQDF